VLILNRKISSMLKYRDKWLEIINRRSNTTDYCAVLGLMAEDEVITHLAKTKGAHRITLGSPTTGDYGDYGIGREIYDIKNVTHVEEMDSPMRTFSISISKRAALKTYLQITPCVTHLQMMKGRIDVYVYKSLPLVDVLKEAKDMGNYYLYRLDPPRMDLLTGV